MYQKYFKLVWLFWANLFLFANSLSAGMAEKFRIFSNYGDHMVLQRQKPICISGTAPAGQKVMVSLTGKGEKYSAEAAADKNGVWTAELPALEAGGPYQMSIRGAEHIPAVEFKDILIGEVWLCSGQSNMECPLWSDNPYWRSENGDKAADDAADYPQIRFFNIDKRISPKGRFVEPCGSGWQVSSADAARPFSAVGFYFARQLHKDLKMPVGMVNANWGGSCIETWISKDAYQRHNRPELKRIDAYFQRLDSGIVQAEDQEEWFRNFESYIPEGDIDFAGWAKKDLNDSDWEKGRLFPAETDGVMWFRNRIELPEHWQGNELELHLGIIDDTDEVYFNGVKIGETTRARQGYWMIPRCYKISADSVRAGTNVIAIRVADYRNGGGLLGKTGEMFLKNGQEKLVLPDKWRQKLEFAVTEEKFGIQPDISFQFPGTLFNSMLAPWTRYPMRGFIWYQGCANVQRAYDYLNLQPMLAEDWRNHWQDENMPFIFVQISGLFNHQPGNPLPLSATHLSKPEKNPSWAVFREKQAETLRLIKTSGMAISIDKSDPFDIHPAKKEPIGFRLAKEAERVCYGSSEISRGPVYRSMKIAGNTIELSFDNVGSGLVATGKLNGFSIAGRDGEFYWADAVICNDKIAVSSPHVQNPAAVRYAWAQFIDGLNLYNREGFPAEPFRTDSYNN